ncbi:hypothetical protein JAAARDRAFT_27646 [Jaapia argillacea MUCL 33604]|uniref:Uncharacterized protein n=1 Tax=Jaapia argillacea MUCL 33604 TaxID=933084 RepID=A0A067QAA2_9AGAM|nr:hypothetical protein JAAARDRAFT_27646 [Jaapia argillacea MUCL 33604]
MAGLPGGHSPSSRGTFAKHREASRTTRYQSITIQGLDQLQGFVSSASPLPAEFRHVRNLFVSGCPDLKAGGRKVGKVDEVVSRPIPVNPNDFNSPTVVIARRRLLQREEALFRLEASKKTSETFNEVLSILLNLIADTLETLSLMFCNTLHLPPLPVLTDLTICGRARNSPISLALPSLDRLHIVGPYYNREELIDIIRSAPSLTHIRLSAVLSNLTSLTALFRLILHHQGPLTDPAPHTIQPQLQRVFIQPRFPPQFGGPGMYSSMGYSSKLQRLIDSSLKVDEGRRLVLLDSQVWDEDVDRLVEEEMGHWKSRMLGGEGCWSSPRATSSSIGHSDGCLCVRMRKC